MFLMSPRPGVAYMCIGSRQHMFKKCPVVGPVRSRYICKIPTRMSDSAVYHLHINCKSRCMLNGNLLVHHHCCIFTFTLMALANIRDVFRNMSGGCTLFLTGGLSMFYRCIIPFMLEMRWWLRVTDVKLSNYFIQIIPLAGNVISSNTKWNATKTGLGVLYL